MSTLIKYGLGKLMQIANVERDSNNFEPYSVWSDIYSSFV
jgi:hypothetical protein